jgi:hypothetical protein
LPVPCTNTSPDAVPIQQNSVPAVVHNLVSNMGEPTQKQSTNSTKAIKVQNVSGIRCNICDKVNPKYFYSLFYSFL